MGVLKHVILVCALKHVLIHDNLVVDTHRFGKEVLKTEVLSFSYYVRKMWCFENRSFL